MRMSLEASSARTGTLCSPDVAWKTTSPTISTVRLRPPVCACEAGILLTWPCELSVLFTGKQSV